MTSNRFSHSPGHCPARAGIALWLFSGAILTLVASAACGGDDSTAPNNYIGVTDAAHPRLGQSERADAGTAR